MPTPNEFGVYSAWDCMKIEIPLGVKQCRLDILTVKGDDGLYVSSAHYENPLGGGGGLPSDKRAKHQTYEAAFMAETREAEDYFISMDCISPANKKKISQAIKKARQEFPAQQARVKAMLEPNKPEEKQLMVIENENRDPQSRVKRTALNDQQKIRSIKFEGDKCKIAYTTALGDDAAKHSVECKAGMAFGLHEIFVGVSLGFQVTGCADFNTTKIDFSYEDGELSYLSVEGLTELARPFAGRAQIKAADLPWGQIAKACPHVEDKIWDLLDATKQFLAGQRKAMQLTFDVITE